MTMGKDPERAFCALPPEHTLADITEYMAPPARIKQRIGLLTVASFIEYVTRFALPTTTIFANEANAQYEGVIDYHGGDGEGGDVGEPMRGDCDHTARYECPKSDQWKAWSEANKAWMDQTTFAAFIEQNLRDIFQPSGAVMMQVALELQVHKAAAFQSEVRLDNGQARFRYEETIRGTTKAGDLDIPTAFGIKIPVFIDGPSFEIECRFRYRLKEGVLAMGYELVRPADVWREAVKQVTKQISDGLTDCKVYVGVRG
jgi:uncharacterized protein YfdQ (DUF2303 family)